MFTGTVSRIEMNATGSRLVAVTRVGKFVNVPELLALSAVFSDVVTRDQVPVQLPQLVDGRRRIVNTTPGQQVTDFITDLGYRSDHLDPRKPRIDNPLKIGGDGRNVSLDPRLAHLGPPEDGGRPATVAREILRIHDYSKEYRYLDEFGAPHPTPGALQIVFCDRGTPKADGDEFTIYAAIRDALIAGGMDAETIRFIHDARGSAEKLQLQADARTGAVSVLLGSTEKMGTGTNVQARAIALHHVDVPWRPADLEQREGRIIRQGNQNQHVEVLNYVAKGTFDTVMWQTVERKAVFIQQAKRNEVDVREIEDLGGGDIGESAAATKAIATGDPRYLRRVELDDVVRRLGALSQAHQEAAEVNRWRLSDLRKNIAALTAQIATLDGVIAGQDAAGLAYTVYPHLTTTGPSERYTQRTDAALPFADACRQAWARKAGASRPFPVGAIDDVDVLAAHDLFNGRLHLTLAVPSRVREVHQSALFGDQATLMPDTDDSSPQARARGILQRAENLYKELPEVRDDLAEARRRAEIDVGALEGLGESPFEHAAELEAKRLELTELTLELQREEQSAAAIARAQAAAERLAATGREQGWSLWLNPTPALVEEAGLASAAELRELVLATQAQRAADYARKRYAAANSAGADHEHPARNGLEDAGATSGGNATEATPDGGRSASVRAARHALGSGRGPTPEPPRPTDVSASSSPPPATARPTTARPETRKR